ncbi:tyrosine-type recombinase/integrase [Haloferula sp. BvORR071]|uniref:site-specific integrase n=1 Tax=Haloferula sp. BvORR071 TaxID=1396141 RepID=UPI000551FA20|nr:tyrosine-type recombinase/integrase [Haloferula sp. BvORR071]
MKALKQRGSTYYVQAKNPQKGRQDETSLLTDDKRLAVTRRNRFLTTLEETGSWDAAKEELHGKKIIKKGESPTFEEMKELYRKYVDQCAKPIRKVTFSTNVSSLKGLMAHAKANTIADLNADRMGFTSENRQKVIGQIKQVKAILKPAALKFYNTQGVKVANPFVGMELGGAVRNPYTPLPEATRKAIWEDARALPPDEAIAVLLALGAGLRKNEIDKARVAWLGMMKDHAILNVRKEDDFTPKSGANRNIPISKALAEELLAIRAKMNPSEFDPYLLAGSGRGASRKDKTFRRVNAWLKTKGITATEPLHSLRKEFGSNVFTHHGVGVASVLLGHADIKLTMDTYAGLTKAPVIDMGGLILGTAADDVEAFAKAQGVKVEALRKWLAKQPKAS